MRLSTRKCLKLLVLLALSTKGLYAQLSKSNFDMLDYRIEKVKDSLKIPGIQIAVTVGDSLAFIKGYGYSNIDHKTEVNPYQSKFQIGSITKVFTAICVQNAANTGSLNLDNDIADYLDFDIKRPFGDKITLNDLLSHSAGIDEMWYNGGDEYSNIENVREALRRIPIKQIRPVGETFGYSNLSVNLAGYILAQDTQKPTHRHYEDVIFKPLGLNNTGVSLYKDEDRPVSYYLIGNQLLESPLVKSNLYTSGHIYSTAEDMSKFMTALLNKGRLDSTLSFGSDYLGQIGRKRFAYKEHDEYGVGLGIFITDTKKGKVFSHLGFVEGFASQMYLFENEKIGFFISANSQKGVQGLQEIFLFFLKQYLPQYQSEKIGKPVDKVELKDFEGNYIPTRTSLSAIGRIESLFSPRLTFEESEDGLPIISSGSQQIKLVPTGPNKFVDTTKFIHKTISFNSSDERMIMNYAVDKGIYGIWPFMRLKWYEKQIIQYPFRMVCTLLFLLTPIVWFLSYLLKKTKRKVSWKKLILSISMLSSAVGFAIFLFSSIDYERMQMLAVESLPWQINAFAIFNIASLFFLLTSIILMFFYTKERFNRWAYLVLVLLILTGINNYIYNSFSLITY